MHARFPHSFNYPLQITAENAERQYRLACRMMRVMKLTLCWTIGYLQIRALAAAEGRAEGLGAAFLPLLLTATLLPLVVYLIVARRDP